jgi:hypothetical protein
MPFPSNLFFKPSDQFLQTWSLVPQVRTLRLSNQKTKALYSSLSPAIPIFYVLMICAIGFDIYLGFSILAKQGVSIGLIVGSVILDLFFAIMPFLVECYIVKDWNHVKVENQIFQTELETMCRRRGEKDEDFDSRKMFLKGEGGELKKLRAYKRNGSILRIIMVMLIFAIAFWKIWTFSSVLPPSLNLFSLVNGKIVVIFSILCALFHVIGSEKAFAHLMFWFRKTSELRDFMRTYDKRKPNFQIKPIEFEGEFINAEAGNTVLAVENENVLLKFIHLIRDDEISSLINQQTDEAAKRAIAIACKQVQII